MFSSSTIRIRCRIFLFIFYFRIFGNEREMTKYPCWLQPSQPHLHRILKPSNLSSFASCLLHPSCSGERRLSGLPLLRRAATLVMACLFRCTSRRFVPRGAEVRLRPYCWRCTGALLLPARVTTPATASVCGELMLQPQPSCRPSVPPRRPLLR